MLNADAEVISNLITSLGTTRFGDAIDSLLRPRVKFDMSCGFIFRFNCNAVLVHNGYNRTVPESTLSAYIRGGYLLDPFYVACVNDHPAGLWRMSELAPDSFFSSGFSISKDLHPCVSSEHGTNVEEIGIIIPLRPQVSAVYSVMRYRHNGEFSDEEMEYLSNIKSVIASAFEAHCKISFPQVHSEAVNSGTVLEDAFMDILQGQLTDSQRYVSKLILQGHSSSSIAANLGISEGTVKVHKHNIYQRLEISSNAELFRLFINYLAKTA
ncbi:response regulator transcription factor [Pseudomonas eucalypticola]|uniref:LuxR family transcriptional regulator n=1 Tax=Pseudomonas eucalypticola TaxID=2599595 RepID=A0A7D5D6N6_9PSED|nr:LuxR C-terminal-related transcriptional regulator [Pseudomonas eucalypticola]QKZ04217.1 LuxR family transcriptional regulator [Pseudomonas eucalypticola]